MVCSLPAALTISYIELLITEPVHNAVILHEDKQYYPSANDVYGADVETLVQEEDAQPLTQPIIAPVKVRKWTVEEKDMPETRFDKAYLLNMTSFPDMIRNVAVVGHLHHGKTALMDTLVFETHKLVWDSDKPVRLWLLCTPASFVELKGLGTVY